MAFEVILKKAKETKRTVVFQTEDQTAPITSVYVGKFHEISKAESIKLSIEAAQ